MSEDLTLLPLESASVSETAAKWCWFSESLSVRGMLLPLSPETRVRRLWKVNTDDRKISTDAVDRRLSILGEERRGKEKRGEAKRGAVCKHHIRHQRLVKLSRVWCIVEVEEGTRVCSREKSEWKAKSETNLTLIRVYMHCNLIQFDTMNPSTSDCVTFYNILFLPASPSAVF